MTDTTVRVLDAHVDREWCVWRGTASATGRGVSSLESRARRLRVCIVALSAAAGLPPSPSPASALLALHELVTAAVAEEPALGRAEGWRAWTYSYSYSCSSRPTETIAARPDLDSETDTEEEPEHLQWPDRDQVSERCETIARYSSAYCDREVIIGSST